MGKQRKRGDGSIRLRSDGRWEGRLYAGRDVNGKQITKSVTAATKEECLKKLDEVKKTLSIVDTKVSSQMTFGEWIDTWYKTYCRNTIREGTRESYENRIYGHIIPMIGDVPLEKLQQSDLQQFYARLKKEGRLTLVEKFGSGVSDRMVRSCHTSCRAALEKAKQLGMIRVNPATGCKLPPKKAREMQVLTHDEMRRFLIQSKEDDFYEIAVLELSTGMRRGEICGLQWSDLNEETGELHICRQVRHTSNGVDVSEPKTKASIRTVVIPPSVVNILLELKKTATSKWIFQSPVKEDCPRDPQGVYKKMKTILKRAECKEIRFHDLRHTFATTALENGMDVKMLSAIIGHTSSATTIDIYSHVTNQMQFQAANKIENGFGRGEAYEHGEVPMDQLKKKEEPVLQFTPYKGKLRKPGTGCIYQINDHLWEGSYHPTNAEGKREGHTVYAKTREECEILLEEMITEVKARIKEEKIAKRQEVAFDME